MARYGREEDWKRLIKETPRAPEVPPKKRQKRHFVDHGKSVIAIVRTDDRITGIDECLRLLGGVDFLRRLKGDVLVKPNSNSGDPFPASTHPETVRRVIEVLLSLGIGGNRIIMGDMSGWIYMPTRKSMEENGIMRIAEELGVKVSLFDEENKWVTVRPEGAGLWPEGFPVAMTAHNASTIISLPALKTHRSGVFTLSLKNTMGMTNLRGRGYLHLKKEMNSLIAELNLAYQPALVILDGMKCFVTGGPAKGDIAQPEVIIAGDDRVAIDAVGAAILKFHKAVGIVDKSVKDHEQLDHASKIGLGNLNIHEISLRTANLAGDERFTEILSYIERELQGSMNIG
ncbi:MAG: DUF362 domain-containing protein [Nitrososphaeria archaeon]|nr:DUF362 domain-containing protein [Nitrososphaeria archaeon]NIN53613.1 DUF362 domain-containing protein [Nitrososphaeria archaeon]NIQ34134.1 DUF362 domain-containing protein [Nitrososphaeria archaeon]